MPRGSFGALDRRSKRLAETMETWIMEPQTKHSQADQHDSVKQKYNEVQSDGRYEEGMARMALSIVIAKIR